jgi:AraC-like DNA-binding protein
VGLDTSRTRPYQSSTRTLILGDQERDAVFVAAGYRATPSPYFVRFRRAVISALFGDTPYRDAAAKERNVKLGTLRSAVEAEVEKLLPDGKAQAENVAKVLGLSLRTLARRLAEEGTTYGEVVDQLRKSLATQYLNDPGMSLGQIAWLLGYEGSTSFNHAFKRWTGRSPSADRNR